MSSAEYLSLSIVFITGILTYLITKYQIKKNYDFELKKNWRNEVLNSVTILCEKASLYHHSQNVHGLGANVSSELMHQANSMKYKLNILLDNNNSEQSKLLKLIHNVVVQMFEGNAKAQEIGSPVHKAILQLIDQTKIVLKAG